ncbi:hypothetical protein OEZ86_010714 [Tetradesmus obliquus]|nr:hypothetical protein OEZ86_010714 [Tetradesmus obliquus]
MLSVGLLALLFNLLVSPAHALDTVYSCHTPGKVGAIGCWHDEAGFVTGLAFEDDYGVKSPAMCKSHGEPDVYIPLRPHESIVEIVACEGLVPDSGYSLIKFLTDGSDDGYECGYGLSDYDAAEAARLGERYKYYGISKHELRLKTHAKVPGNCKSITSGRVPRWFRREQQQQQLRAARWHADSSFHGERYTIDGKTYDKLGNIDPATGRECSDCGPAGYYYTQVYPLAQLEASCSADGTRLQQLESACWNQEYRPAPNLVVLAVTFQFSGDCKGCIGGCPDEQRSDYVRSLAAYVVSEQLLEYRMDAKVKAAVLECKPPLTYVLHNTSLSVAVSASMNQREKEDVQLVLHSWLEGCSSDLCNCLPVGVSCADLSILGIDVKFIATVPRGARLEYPSSEFMEAYDLARTQAVLHQTAEAAHQQANSAHTQVMPPAF